jgi:hypothetical protein
MLGRMFEIVPERHFRIWYEGLSEPQAEEVTTALEVVAHAAETLDPPGVSRALLWFDGTAAGAPGVGSPGAFALELALERSAEGLRSVLAWQRELLTCLDSPVFRRRLEQLPEPSAAAAITTVEQLRAELRRWQTRLALELHTGRVSVDVMRERRAALMREFSSVLALLGFEPGHFIALASGLRELVVARTTPRLRILFGIDVTEKRLVVLLGEALDRAYYGDSVRSAAARWASYQGRTLERRASE